MINIDIDKIQYSFYEIDKITKENIVNYFVK